MNASNPYAPPRAKVQDINDPSAADVPAERGTRLVATIVDGLIFGAMVYLPFVVGFAMGGRSSSAGVGIAATLALAGLIVWIWLTVKYVNANGQSIGKKLLGIKVVRTDGSPISLGRIFWMRNVVNSVLGLIPLYGFVDALLIFGEQRQCVHDKLADTLVIKA